jgi:hypothetical protein
MKSIIAFTLASLIALPTFAAKERMVEGVVITQHACVKKVEIALLASVATLTLLNLIVVHERPVSGN